MDFRRAFLLCLCAVFLLGAANQKNGLIDFDWLRKAYAGPPESWPAARVEKGVDFVEFGPVEQVPRPTDDKGRARIALGRKLFADPRLSGSGQIACQSCHNSRLGWGDGLPRPFGHNRQSGTRNAQSLFAAPYMKELFWDGRASSLEAQAHFPITSPIEMAAEIGEVEERLNADPEYRAGFAFAYNADPIAMADVAKALGDFQRSIRLPFGRWQRAMRDGTQVFSNNELWGLHLFRTKAGCANCHHGPLLTDQKYHNIGISFYGRRQEDVGRYAVTGDPLDVGAFRTPSLLGLSRTAPYMHNGGFLNLRGIVNIYANGGGRERTEQSSTTNAPPPTVSPFVKRRELTRAERAALVEFLETL